MLISDLPSLGGTPSLDATPLSGAIPAGAEEEISLLEAMVLGQRSQLDRRLNEIFIRAGCVHFLAVSGLHLAIPMSFVWWLGRRFGLSGRQCAWLMLGALLTYAIIAEPRPPILRAGVMGTLFCLSLMFGRPRAALNWLAAAAILLCAWRPQMVFGVGFQLSFASVLGIIYLPPVLHAGARALWRGMHSLRGLPPATSDELRSPNQATLGGGRRERIWWQIKRAIWRFVLIPLGVGVGAWLVCMPIVATWFYRVHPWGPLSTVVIFPLVYLVIIVAFAKVLLELVSPGLGALLAGVLMTVDSLLIRLAEWLGSLPGASIIATAPPWWWMGVYYGVLALFAWRFRRRIRFYHAGESMPEKPPLPGVIQSDGETTSRGAAPLHRFTVGSRTIAQADACGSGRVPSVSESGDEHNTPVGNRCHTGDAHASPVGNRGHTGEDHASPVGRWGHLIGVFGLLLISTAVWCWPKGESDRLVVTFLSVGAGSATVIELPEGQTILYDAGALGSNDVGHNVVVPFLRHRGIKRIDRVYVSHPNLDHLNGLPAILEEVETGPIVINEWFDYLSEPRSSGRRLLDLLADRGHEVRILDPRLREWTLGGVKFELLWPRFTPHDRRMEPSKVVGSREGIARGDGSEGVASGDRTVFGDRAAPIDEVGPDDGMAPRGGRNDYHLSGNAGSLSCNDSSTVLRLTYAGHSVLLTGDIEEHPQRTLVDQGALQAEVLVLPHHGSVRNSTEAFIQAVAPSVIIQSSNKRTGKRSLEVAPNDGPAADYDNTPGNGETTGDGNANGDGLSVTRHALGPPVENRCHTSNTADVGAIQVVIDADGVRASSMLGRK